MTQEEFKWANELHWQVKGHLIPESWAHDEKQVKAVFDSYFKRVWGNHESITHMIGFEEAWNQRYSQNKD